MRRIGKNDESHELLLLVSLLRVCKARGAFGFLKRKERRKSDMTRPRSETRGAVLHKPTKKDTMKAEAGALKEMAARIREMRAIGC